MDPRDLLNDSTQPAAVGYSGISVPGTCLGVSCVGGDLMNSRGILTRQPLGGELQQAGADVVAAGIEFRRPVFDAFCAAFGDCPAPWPTQPAELLGRGNDGFYREREIELESMTFADWNTESSGRFSAIVWPVSVGPSISPLGDTS